MPTNSLVPEGSPLAGLPSSFRKLQKTAAALNAASDDLGKTVELLDVALRKLNLGVVGWTRFDGWSDELGNEEDDYLGYAKSGDRWGLSIKVVEGHINDPDGREATIYLFNDAPRELRIKAIGVVPKLIEHLNTLAEKMVDTLAEKTKEARLIALGMHTITPQNGAK